MKNIFQSHRKVLAGGSSLKRDGKLANPVDAKRVAALVKAVEQI